MKPLHELTNKDLAADPIWLYQGKSDETAEVRPCAGFEDPDREGYIARTRFVLHDGSERFGYCSPQDDSGLAYIQPAIIAANGHARFYYDDPPSHQEPEHLCELLGKSPSDVFPVTYECLVPFEGRCLKGEIHEVWTGGGIRDGKNKPRRSWRGWLFVIAIAGGLLAANYFFGSTPVWIVLIGCVVLGGVFLLLPPLLSVFRARLRGTPVMWTHRGADGASRGKCPVCRSPIRFSRGEDGAESFTCEECGEAGSMITQSRDD